MSERFTVTRKKKRNARNERCPAGAESELALAGGTPMANKFSGTRWGRLPLSVLEEIERIVGEHMPKERKNDA